MQEIIFLLHVSAYLIGQRQVHKGKKITLRRSVAFTNIEYNNHIKILYTLWSVKQAETCCRNIVNLLHVVGYVFFPAHRKWN